MTGMTVKYLQLSRTLAMKVSAHDGSRLPRMRIDLFKNSVEQKPLVTWSIFDVWRATKTDIPIFTSTSSVQTILAIFVIEQSILEMFVENSLNKTVPTLGTLTSNVHLLMEQVQSVTSSNTPQKTLEHDDFGN
jgi:hypothetical protein